MSTNLKIVLAEPSAIIRAGLEIVMKKVSGFRIQLIEIQNPENLSETIKMQRPDILLVNPLLVNSFYLSQLKEECECPDLKCFALLYSVIDPAMIRLFDGNIDIYDAAEEIKNKLDRIVLREIAEETDLDDSQSLSVREKEIVVCVVKGMTNREIADKLYLSTHTVITHRRNIARKLQIHSASGLTVYAIVNKLVELGDIQPKG